MKLHRKTVKTCKSCNGKGGKHDKNGDWIPCYRCGGSGRN